MQRAGLIFSLTLNGKECRPNLISDSFGVFGGGADVCQCVAYLRQTLLGI